MRIYYLYLILIGSFCNAQKISLASASMKPFPYSAIMIEESNQNIYYDLKFVRDTKKPQSKRQAICILQLGNKFSRFADNNFVKLDSLDEKYSHQQAITPKEFSVYNSFFGNWSNVLVKNLVEKKNIVQDYAKNKYQYEELQPNLNWRLEKNTKEILGYICYKATTEFRGRKYIAWYAKNIPINNGPYIFEGLPGLIMEIEDIKGEYHFTAVAIDKKIKNMYLRNEKQILHVTREQFRRTQKDLHDNPGFFYGGNTYDENGNPINERWRKKPYNPIELN